MRFTLSSTALSAKLVALSRVINSKNSLPILADFVFEVKDNKLYLTASDSENTMKTCLDLNESDGNGSFAVGNHDLLEAVKGFSEQPLEIDVDMELRQAKIKYQNGQFILPVESAEDYPLSQEPADGATTINIPSGVLLDNLNRSLFATAQDELRPVMNGVYFDLTTECLAIVASDGHKLVRNKVLTIKSDEQSSFILPKKPAALLKNMLAKDETNVSIIYDGRNAEIVYDDGVLLCRLIEGRYPNYNSVIPNDNPNSVTIDRVGLLNALRHVQPFASEASNLVRFELSNGVLKLDAEDYDFAKTATESVTCEYSGTPMKIGFKGTAFIDILSSFESDEVTIKLADPSRAGIVLPSEQPEGQEVLMLMMPMLINE